MTDFLMRVVGLHKAYGSNGVEIPILRGVNLDINEGEILSIVGSSGAGKSTLLHLVGGLDRPTRGEIIYKGKNILALSDGELDRFRNSEVGFIFQFHHLLPEFTAIENVAIAALIGNSNSAFSDAEKLLDYVGLSDRLEHNPSELSGGERQRVAIARALINEPKLLLADEPTGNLDQKTGEEILELVWSIHEQFNQTMLIVTHDEVLARRADRQIQIIDGKIMEKKC